MTRRTIAFVLAVLTATAAAPAGAATRRALSPRDQQRTQQISQQITSLRAQVAEASNEESALLGRLDDVQARRAELDGKVKALDGQIASVQRDVDAAQSKLDELQGEFVRAQTKLAIANGQVAEARSELRDRAVSAYVDNPKTHAADVMLRANSLRQLAATLTYFKAVVAVQRSALDRFSALRDDVDALRQSLERTKDEARQQRDVVLSREAVLESARAQQADLRAQVLDEERQQQALLDEVQARKAEFEAQIAALRAESDTITGLLRSVQAGQGVAPSGHGLLGVPIPGALVTSPFGSRMHPIFHEIRMHTGVDFGADAGTPIRAAADGVVVAAGPRGGYGNATIIDHGRSMATLYAHQSSIVVNPGDQVRRGQVIGYVGCTGYCTGPHLHFEVRINGTPVDPLGYL